MLITYSKMILGSQSVRYHCLNRIKPLLNLGRWTSSRCRNRWTSSLCNKRCIISFNSANTGQFLHHKHHFSSATTAEPLTISTCKDNVRTICLNDPKKRNALSLAMLDSLKKDLEEEDENLRVIVIKSSGPVFSAGHNLKELTTATGKSHHEQVFKMCTEVMTLIQELPVPVIAQVTGLATAAGCQLAATCDIVIATESSKFATPGVSVGLFCSTPAVAVGRSVPSKVAMEMLFTGHPISAQDALLHGLVSRVVPDGKIEDETMEVIRRILVTSKSVAAIGKATFYAQMKMDRKEAYRLAGDVMVENLSYGDAQEGIKAFTEKRKPLWDHSSKKVH